MGYTVKGSCYASLPDARTAFCNDINRDNVVGANIYTHTCTSGANSPMTICARTNGGTCTNISVPFPSFPTGCDPLAPFSTELSLEAGALIAGAVLAVWAVGYGFRAVIRSLNIDGKTSTSESEI